MLRGECQKPVCDEESGSFMKKRTKRLCLFRLSQDRGHGREGAASARNKSLLLLFFRKEDLTLNY
jgi:hypothetical protein